MKVIHVKTGTELHVKNDDWVKVALLEGVLRVAPVEAPAPPAPNAIWIVSRGAQDPFLGELRIEVSCATCHNGLTFFKPTADRTFTHCAGIVEKIPVHVFESYKKKLEAQMPKKKTRTLPPGTVFHVEI